MRWLLPVVLLVFVRPVVADNVELTNGDVLHGRVVSLDEKELKLASEIHGQLTIRRDKVAALYLCDRPARVAPVPAAPATSARPRLSDQDPARGPLDGPTGAAKPNRPLGEPSVDDVLRQLRVEGLDKGDLKQLEDKLPLLGQPEVRDYFNKTLSGLLSGDLSVNDLRQQAIKARQQIKDLEKDLGPGGAEALKGYMSILDKFIDDSDPMKKKLPLPDAPLRSP